MPFSSWLNISLTPESEVKLAVLILGVYILCGIPIGLVTSVYQSLAEFPRMAMLLNLQQIMLIILLAFVLFFKCNFVTVSLVQYIPLLGLLLFTIFDIKHRHPEVSFSFSDSDWKLSLSFIGPGFLFLMISLSYIVRIQGIILVISILIGASGVAIFSVHRTLAFLIWRFTGPIRASLWPEITVIDAAGNYGKMRLIHNLLMKTTLFISITFSVFLFFSGRDIIRVWTRDKIEFQPVLWMLLLGYLPINCIWETSGLFQISTNKHVNLSIYRIISVILGMILCVILTKAWGITGALFGFIIAEVVICWIISIETLKIVKIKKLDFLFNTIGKGLFIGIPQIAFAYLISSYIPNIYIQWPTMVAGIFTFGLITAYLLWMTNDEKALAFELIKRFRR
jgi:O-antigen/teichoic acid export membrane protein